MGSPEIILNQVCGTETMTDKRFEKFWRLFGEIVCIQKWQDRSWDNGTNLSFLSFFLMIESFFDPKSIDILPYLMYFWVDKWKQLLYQSELKCKCILAIWTRAAGGRNNLQRWAMITKSFNLDKSCASVCTCTSET